MAIAQWAFGGENESRFERINAATEAEARAKMLIIFGGEQTSCALIFVPLSVQVWV